jgi:hypothetical protein
MTRPMTFRDSIGPVARTVFALIGLLLLIAAVASIYADWPLVRAGKSSLLGMAVTALITLPLGLLILLWSAIGHVTTWRIAPDGIYIRIMSLNQWAHEDVLTPDEIAGIELESFIHDHHGRRSVHWVTVTTTGGRQHRSPRVYDPMVAEALRSRIAALERRDISAFTP